MLRTKLQSTERLQSRHSFQKSKRILPLVVAVLGVCGRTLPAAADSISVTYAAANVSGSTYSDLTLSLFGNSLFNYCVHFILAL